MDCNVSQPHPNLDIRQGSAQDLMGISRSFRRRIKQTIQMEDVQATVVEEGLVWSIPSSSDLQRSYFLVKQISSCFDSTQSGFELEEQQETTDPCVAFQIAKTCRHSYSCGCSDYLNGSTCKHILRLSAIQGLWNPALASLHKDTQSSVLMLVNAAIDSSSCVDYASLNNDDEDVPEIAQVESGIDIIGCFEKLQAVRRMLQVLARLSVSIAFANRPLGMYWHV
jgi:hypothetical protein